MTAEEFFDFAHRPDNRDRHFELVEGEVVEMSRPGEIHGVVCANVGWVLGAYSRQVNRGYVCSNDTGILLERNPDTVCGPDLAFYLQSKKWKELEKKYSERLPDLAVEVLSPNDRFGIMTRRIGQFLALGVKMVWLIDPDARNATLYLPGEIPIVLDETEEISQLALLPDFTCKVADFFRLSGDN